MVPLAWEVAARATGALGMGDAADEKPDDEAAQQDAPEADRQQRVPGAFHLMQPLLVGGEQDIAEAALGAAGLVVVTVSFPASIPLLLYYL